MKHRTKYLEDSYEPEMPGVHKILQNRGIPIITQMTLYIHSVLVLKQPLSDV